MIISHEGGITCPACEFLTPEQQLVCPVCSGSRVLSFEEWLTFCEDDFKTSPKTTYRRSS